MSRFFAPKSLPVGLSEFALEESYLETLDVDSIFSYQSQSI